MLVIGCSSYENDNKAYARRSAFRGNVMLRNRKIVLSETVDMKSLFGLFANGNSSDKAI